MVTELHKVEVMIGGVLRVSNNQENEVKLHKISLSDRLSALELYCSCLTLVMVKYDCQFTPHLVIA